VNGRSTPVAADLDAGRGWCRRADDRSVLCGPTRRSPAGLPIVLFDLEGTDMNAMGSRLSSTAQVPFGGRSDPARRSAPGAVAGRFREAVCLGVIGLAIATLWSSAPRPPLPGETYVEASPVCKQCRERCLREARADHAAAATVRWTVADARPVDAFGFAPAQAVAGQPR